MRRPCAKTSARMNAPSPASSMFPGGQSPPSRRLRTVPRAAIPRAAGGGSCRRPRRGARRTPEGADTAQAHHVGRIERVSPAHREREATQEPEDADEERRMAEIARRREGDLSRAGSMRAIGGQPAAAAEPVGQAHALRRHLNVDIEGSTADQAIAVTRHADRAVDEQEGGEAQCEDEEEVVTTYPAFTARDGCWALTRDLPYRYSMVSVNDTIESDMSINAAGPPSTRATPRPGSAAARPPAGHPRRSAPGLAARAPRRGGRRR